MFRLIYGLTHALCLFFKRPKLTFYYYPRPVLPSCFCIHDVINGYGPKPKQLFWFMAMLLPGKKNNFFPLLFRQCHCHKFFFFFIFSNGIATNFFFTYFSNGIATNIVFFLEMRYAPHFYKIFTTNFK